jgi:hypothetical protein
MAPILLLSAGVFVTKHGSGCFFDGRMTSLSRDNKGSRFGSSKKITRRQHDEEGEEQSAGTVDLSLYKATITDLARSGLDKKDYKLLRLEPMDAEATDEFVGEDRSSYKIPYFDLDGRRIAYSRVRFLETRKRKRFSGDTRDGTFRYSQPANSSPHVYFPPYFNWRKIAKDVEQKIVITEGEKKAACACKHGVATIALGGVFAFQSSKRGQDMIPDMLAIEWKDREVEICFDADVMMKSQVAMAMNRLCATLNSFGPKTISLIHMTADGPAGGKTGIDDLIVSSGVEAFEALERVPYEGATSLQALNTRICWVNAQQAFFDIFERKFFKSMQHVREAFMNTGTIFNGSQKGVLAIDEWFRWRNRREVSDVAYLPGKEPMTDRNVLNMWTAPPIQPKKGRPDKWLELVYHVMREPEYADWFLQWLAYPIQHPGTKLFQACFVHGEQTGVGKTFIVDPVMELVYGRDNFFRLSSDDLTDKHNTFFSKSVFVVTNEVWMPQFTDRTNVMSILKDMITRESGTVNEKYQPKMKHIDHCNYYLTSNHANALIIEKTDRRFFVIEAPKKRLGASEYTELDNWLRHEGGAAQILYHLQHLDISKFNRKGAALETKFREQCVGLSRDFFADFVDRLVADPEPLFMVNGNLPDLELYRAEDIVHVFDMVNPKLRMHIAPNMMGRLLKNAGLERRAVRFRKDAPLRVLYAVFKGDQWGQRKNVEWAEHYTDKSRLFGGKSRH